MDFKKIPGKKERIKREVINTEKPTISIVTPYYNAKEFFEETYRCVLNQTYPFFEWIIVNDGSKDEESNELVERLAKTDSRIKYYKKENGGPSIARDYGIAKAAKSTKYVFFIDADDQMDDTMLECLYWTLETHPEASFAYTSSANFGDREFLWEKYLTIEQEKEENLINICAMVRKEDLLEVGCFGIKEKSMYEDWNLWLKLIRAGKVPLRVNTPLFWYRTSASGELSRAQKNHKQAMRYVEETAKGIKDNQVEPIQFPRYGNPNDTVKNRDLILPDYKKDKRKTILYLFPWLVIGGADYFNLDLIKRLPKDKYRNIILTTIPNRNPLRQSFEDYAEVYDMSSFLDRIDYLSFTDYIISSRKVDLVFISNTEYGYYMVPYLKSKYPKIPFMDYIHSIDKRDPRGSFGRCTRDVQKDLYKTFCCNNFTKNELKELFEQDNVETVYIGTDEKKYDPAKCNKIELRKKYGIPDNMKVISFIARFSEEKRPLMFTEIAKRIYNEMSDTYFVMAGDGPLMDKVKEEVDDHFKVLGMVEETEEIYAISDVTINCSSLEGLALTSYESLAMEVPVISTDVGGQSELLDEKVGALVHYNPNADKTLLNHEINEYVEKTIEVLKDLDKRKKNSRKRILEGYTLDQMAKKFDMIFEEAIKAESKKTPREENTTMYELACNVLTEPYFKCTNAYYENYLEVYLTAPKSEHKRFLRHMRARLERLNAVKEGKDIIKFLRSLANFGKDFWECIKLFLKAFVSGIKLFLKVLLRLLTKPFRKKED